MKTGGRKLNTQTLIELAIMAALIVLAVVWGCACSAKGIGPFLGTDTARLEALIVTRKCDFITLGGTTYVRCDDGWEGTVCTEGDIQ